MKERMKSTIMTRMLAVYSCFWYYLQYVPWNQRWTMIWRTAFGCYVCTMSFYFIRTLVSSYSITYRRTSTRSFVIAHHLSTRMLVNAKIEYKIQFHEYHFTL